jgi:hypothetical protein
MTPSIYAHVLNGILLFSSVILVIMHFSKISSASSYQVIVLLLLFSIASGIHGLSHLGLENIYGYNPLRSII